VLFAGASRGVDSPDAGAANGMRQSAENRPAEGRARKRLVPPRLLWNSSSVKR
jgi:hypothetical protein